MSNSSDSGKTLNWSGAESLLSRDLDRPRVGLRGDSFSIARDDKSTGHMHTKYKVRVKIIWKKKFSPSPLKISLKHISKRKKNQYRWKKEALSEYNNQCNQKASIKLSKKV